MELWMSYCSSTGHHVFVTRTAAWCLCLGPLTRTLANSTLTYTVSIGGWNLARSQCCDPAGTGNVFLCQSSKRNQTCSVVQVLWVDCWGFCVWLVGWLVFQFFLLLLPSWWLYFCLDVFSWYPPLVLYRPHCSPNCYLFIYLEQNKRFFAAGYLLL